MDKRESTARPPEKYVPVRRKTTVVGPMISDRVVAGCLKEGGGGHARLSSLRIVSVTTMTNATIPTPGALPMALIPVIGVAA